jgi:hypothetical protein
MSKDRGIRIKSRQQFDNLIDHLAAETRRAEEHWRLWGALNAATDYREEMHRTQHFWGLSMRAIQESAILRLARLFDSDTAALSIHNFLTTIHRAAKRDQDPLGIVAAGLDTASLEVELTTVADTDPLVLDLKRIRNKYFAHRDADLVGRGTFHSLPKLRREHIEQMLSRASSITRKYCRLYERPIPSAPIGAEEDYKHLLKLLRLGLKSANADPLGEVGQPVELRQA